MRRLALVLSLLATQFLAEAPSAIAAPPPAADDPDVVVIPRALVALIRQAILHPHSADVGDILAVVQQFAACVDDNPLNGLVRRAGQDQCPEVTSALAARDKELAAARKTVEKAVQPAPPAPSQPPAPAAAAAGQLAAPPANGTGGQQ